MKVYGIGNIPKLTKHEKERERMTLGKKIVVFFSFFTLSVLVVDGKLVQTKL